jgi:YD repeat-containing protein
MMKRLTLLIVIIFAATHLQAQVNLQTGSATFSLPMFSWQDDKSRLNGVVALSYNSGNGLRVSDVASNVGQGWSLIAGGQITRMQAGEPDDQVAYNGNGSDADIRKYPSGILYATVPAANGCPDALTKYPIYGWKNQLYAQHNVIAEDKQLDYFSFQFNGKAGMFVLDPTNIGVAKPLGDTKMKITFQQDANLVNLGIRTIITSFTIQDVDGLIYKFTKHSVAKVLHMAYCDEGFNYKQEVPKFRNDKVYYQSAFDEPITHNPWIIGGWYLTEIEDALTNRKILINYDITSVTENTAGEDVSYNKTGKTNTPNQTKDYGIVTHKISKAKTPEITSIVYPDGHIVTFNYGKPRFDFIGSSAMASVDVAYQGRYLSKYDLATSYFILNRYGTPVTDFQKKVARLCLLSVKKTGVDLKEDTPPYIFNYYTGSSNGNDDFVPPPFSYAKDIWGFYNGNNTTGFWGEIIAPHTPIVHIKGYNRIRGLCYLREGVTGVHLNAKPGYAKNGLLKQIIYPTGGTLTYEYGQNSGMLGGTNTNIGGVHVSQTSSTDGGYSNGCANPITTSYNFVMNGAGSASSLWGLETPKNLMINYNHYQPEYKSYSWNPFKYGLLGGCYWHFQYPGITAQQQAVNLSGFQRGMETAAPVLGILSFLSSVHNILLVATGNGGSVFTLVVDIIVSIATLALSCIGDQSRDYTASVYYNSDLNGAAPLPTQFKRVEVVENPGSAGKTVQEFTSEDDYAIWVPANPIYSSKQRFAPWAYGLPKKTTVYDAGNNIVKQTENLYLFDKAKSIINPCNNNQTRPAGAAASSANNCDSITGVLSDLVSCKCLVTNSSSLRNTKWTDPATYNPGFQTSISGTNVKADFYGMYTGRTELIKSFERNFKPADPANFTEVITDYNYTPSNYEVNKITTTQSNGDKNVKEITYSGDSFGGIYTTLQTNNILSIPVTSINSVQKAGTGTWQDLNEKRTSLVQLSNGDIKPGSIYERRSDKPYNRYPYPPTLPQTQLFTYDAAGNMTGLKDEGGRTISNMYDYNDKYVVASLINTDPLTDTKAYTSFETGVFGGWTLTGISSVTNTAITGVNSFVLSAGKSFSSSVNTAKPHIVSFWATSGGVTVTGGATQTKSAPAYNGFTYYEYDIAQGTATVTVSGSGTIDELRLYPKTARMRTTTYDPLIGKTSDCDENNRITYYEYDNLGRLRFVKDEKKNIVKMQEYNNVSAAKQNGCPGTYYNFLISEQFVKNNCAAGYQGDTVLYSIAANTYSSATSQEDADAQAENNLLINGQAYANANGGCKLIYYNTLISITDTTENCPLGSVGGLVTYTVPAGRYSSLISQAYADTLAMEDIDANADSYMNDPANAICIFSTYPDWTWLEDDPSYCQNVSGQQHRFVFETDINPNSATYNQTRWTDVGPDATCPTTCNFTASPGFSILTSSITNNGSTAGFYIVFSGNSGTNWYGNNQVATVGSACMPTNIQNFTMSESGRTWQITVTPQGAFIVSLIGGSPPGTYEYIGLTNGTYNL